VPFGGENKVSGVSIISVESSSMASVESDSSSLDDDVDDSDYVVDVDDVNTSTENAAGNVSDAADSPDLDIVQSRVVEEDQSVLADEQVSSDSLCSSTVDGTGREVTDDGTQFDLAFCKTTTPENAEENAASAEVISSLLAEENSGKCNDGKQMASANNTMSNSGSSL